VFITQVTLKNFRCFAAKKFSFDKRFVLVEGKNGSGKTSLLEALHYACYLRSFRTHLGRDLIRLDGDKHFYIDILFHEADAAEHAIQIGATDKEKVVKFDGKAVRNYRDIVSQYRAVTLSEDDLQLVQGAPEVRRALLDQSLALVDEGYVPTLRRHRQVLQNRNKLLATMRERGQGGTHAVDELATWTRQLWDAAVELQAMRAGYLDALETRMNKMLAERFSEEGELRVAMRYRARHMGDVPLGPSIHSPSKTTANTQDERGQEILDSSLEAGGESSLVLSDREAIVSKDLSDKAFTHFWSEYQLKHVPQEIQWGRSLFGAHLDDFAISFQNRRARVFASRGQQKLVVFLLKIAQLLHLEDGGAHGVLLLDDFLTDFDQERFAGCLKVLKALPKQTQTFISCPLDSVARKTKRALGKVKRIRL